MADSSVLCPDRRGMSRRGEVTKENTFMECEVTAMTRPVRAFPAAAEGLLTNTAGRVGGFLDRILPAECARSSSGAS
jgi:hypothetical protein